MSIFTDVFGETPKVAKPTPTLLPVSQQQAIGANIAAMPQTAQLGNLYSTYLQGQLAQQLPGYKNILATGAADTAATLAAAQPLLEGQIPQDVQDQVMRSGAFQSLLAGGGEGFTRSLQARDLGLTSLQLQQEGAQLAAQGGNAAQQWQRIADATIFNPSQVYISPAMQQAAVFQNNAQQQAYQQLKYNLAAAPSPVAKGISDTIMTLVDAYVGHGMGGGQGTGSGTGAQNVGQDQLATGGGTFGGGGAGSGWVGGPGSAAGDAFVAGGGGGSNFVPTGGGGINTSPVIGQDFGSFNYDPSLLYGGVDPGLISTGSLGSSDPSAYYNF